MARTCYCRLKHKSQRRLVRPRLNEVRTAERREKIEQCVLICKVGDNDPKSRTVMLAPEQVVGSSSDIEHMARGDPRRIMIVVLRSLSRNHQPCRSVVRRRALRVGE